MGEAARRLAEKRGSIVGLSYSEINQLEQDYEWLLAKIRERRDELPRSPLDVANNQLFWSRFDDGAEFGPDEKGTTFERNNPNGSVVVELPDGTRWAVHGHVYRAIQEGPKLEDL